MQTLQQDFLRLCRNVEQLQSCSLAEHSTAQTRQLLTVFTMPKHATVAVLHALVLPSVADAGAHHLRQNCISSRRMDTVCRMVKTWYRYISFIRCSSRTTYPSIPAVSQCHLVATTVQQAKCIEVAKHVHCSGFSLTPGTLSHLGADEGYSIVQVDCCMAASLLSFNAA